MKHLLVLALLAAACGGLADDAPAWRVTPLDPVREAWGSHDGILTPPAADETGAWCGLVATVDASTERLAPIGADASTEGVSCVVLMPGESVAFYTREGGRDWLDAQAHDRVRADGTCPLRCER